MRQSTFELKDESNEPRSSPPKISSSPVTICSSLSQVSFPSDDGGEGDCFTLQDCLAKTAFYLDKARKICYMKNINDECSSIGFNSSQQGNYFFFNKTFILLFSKFKNILMEIYFFLFSQNINFEYFFLIFQIFKELLKKNLCYGYSLQKKFNFLQLWSLSKTP